MKRLPVLLLALALLAVFAVGALRLFQLRFAHGDIYPAYSSLRSDPLGTKVLYEALSELIPVSRNIRALSNHSPEAAESTLLFLGAKPRDVVVDWHALEDVARFGGRTIVTLYPRMETAADQRGREERARKLEERFGKYSKDSASPSPTPGSENEAGENEAEENGLQENNGAGGRKERGFKTELLDAVDRQMRATFAFAEDRHTSVGWHSTVWFSELDPHWKVIARCKEKPVVIERQIGKGSIVLASDSFFLSNEAMRTERRPEIVSWLLGGGARAVFEESHLSVQESRGIANLLRTYRLHYFLGVLGIIASLFVWRNGTSFVPPHEPEQNGNAVAGHGSASALTNLLRRNIRPGELLRTCVEEWQRTPHREGAAIESRIQAVVQEPGTHPVEGYRAISKILSESKL